VALTGFSDRLAALVEERRSQICLGLDPDPAQLAGAAAAERLRATVWEISTA